MQTKLISNLCGIHGIGKILFVGKNEQERITEFIFVEHPLQLFTGFGDTFAIIGIDNKNDTLGILEIWITSA